MLRIWRAILRFGSSIHGDELRQGNRAPAFALLDQNSATVRLADFLGHKAVVLVFFLRAFTPT